jgi:nitrite reductase/ring-hydroxylating ferredoxin subunit
MSAGYRAVGWNRQKRLYDTILGVGVAGYLVVFAGVTLACHPTATVESVLIRGLGSGALLLLHVALAIGPLARLDRRFLPLLYNRRHLGVATAFLGLGHATFAVVQYHAGGNLAPLTSLLTANGRFASAADFPFELLGLGALAILALMAATSHDFWLAQLGAPVWKRIHMAAYLAYGLLVLHVALGVLQSETSPWLAGVLGLGVGTVLGLHLWAAWRERAGDLERRGGESWVDVCAVEQIPEGRARVVCLSGERVAVFRYDGRISAVSNVCRHQNGPLGEGRVIDGCITCPWHGYQYLPANGSSPPPFTEKVPTFRARLAGDRVEVDPRPLPAGTHVEPLRIPVTPVREPGDDFYVGYLPTAPAGIARFTRRAVVALLAGALGLAAVLGAVQEGFAASEFAYGRPQVVAGVVLERPLPLLLIPGEGNAAMLPVLLVAPGKFGAADLVRGLDGRQVRLAGALAEREGGRLLEIVPGSVETLSSAVPGESVPTRGPLLTLDGEIVDGKCYLGVMNPGEGKVHRGCAVRCLAGGAPALLAVRLAGGGRFTIPLVGRPGAGLVPAILDRVAEPVRVTGELLRRGGAMVLETEPGAIARLPGQA